MQGNSEFNTDVRSMGVAGSMEELGRIKRQQNFGIVLIGCGVICMVLTVLSPVMILFAFALFLYGIYRTRNTGRSFKMIYKQLFVEGPLRQNFQNVVYYWDKGFTSDAVREFGLCSMGNRFYSEDYIRATYNGVNFEMSQVKVQQHTSTGKSSHTTTYFDGRMIVIDFPEKMVLSVQIFSDNFAFRARAPHNMKMHKIKMESVGFNKRFDVLSASEHDAFYLLTPQFMERMDKLLARYGNVAIHLSGNRMFIGVKEPNNDAFDAKRATNKISYPEEMAKVQNDIDDIKRIITVVRDIRFAPQMPSGQGNPQSGMPQQNQRNMGFGTMAAMQTGIDIMQQQNMMQQQNVMPQQGMPQGFQQQNPQMNQQYGQVPEGMPPDGPSAKDILTRSGL